MSWLDEVPWNGDGLIAAVAQDAASGRVLTVAWMNRAALEETARTRGTEIRSIHLRVAAVGNIGNLRKREPATPRVR